MNKEEYRHATPRDFIEGAVVYIDGDDNQMHKKVIDEVLRPSDPFKAFVADDGCRYGLDGCYIKDEDPRLRKMKRQGEIQTAMTVLAQEYKDLESDLNSFGDAPEWARHAAERAFTEADRWHQGIAPFDTEKLAKIIEQEYLRANQQQREG